LGICGNGCRQKGNAEDCFIHAVLKNGGKTNGCREKAIQQECQ
jgi:hypothetical protein